MLRERARGRPCRTHVVHPFDRVGRAELCAFGITAAVVAFEDLVGQLIPYRVAKRTGLDAHLAADALGVIKVDPAGSRVAGQRMRGANRNAGGVSTRLGTPRE